VPNGATLLLFYPKKKILCDAVCTEINLMNESTWIEFLQTKAFWGGVLASIVAACVVAIFVYIFRNAIETTIEKRKRGKEIDQVFSTSLHLGDRHAPLAFIAVQSRALRYFVIAIFVAYIGDILEGFIWPFNATLYCVSLFLIWKSLDWFYRIERRARDILPSLQEERHMNIPHSTIPAVSTTA
jgi:hypothetical protein